MQQKYSKKYFGKIKNKKYEENEKLIDPDLSTNVFVTMKHSTVKQPVWKKFYRTFSYKDDLRKSLALDIGLKILAGGSSSLLYQKLVTEKENVFCSWWVLSRPYQGEGSIYLYAIPRSDMNLQNVDKIIMDELKEIISEKLTSKRFEIEKKIFF